MSNKKAKKVVKPPSSSSSAVANIRKAQEKHPSADLEVSLKDLLSGKGEAVAKAVAERQAMREAAEVKSPKESEREAKAREVKPSKAKKVKADKKESNRNGGERVTVASYMRELINDGKENAEIFKLAQRKFPDLGDDKKWYPAWYRSDMRRKANAAKKAAKGGK